MDIVHLYDGHERVARGEGSVPNVVWNLAVESAKQNHNVSIIERKWSGLPSKETINGVNIRRISLSTGPSEPWSRIPYKQLSTLYGSAQFVADRTNFAIQALRCLKNIEFDILHVHLPFAANVLCVIAPWLRKRMVYTAHIGELEERVIEPTFSPDIHLSSRIRKTIVLNERTFDVFMEQGVDPSSMDIIPNGIETNRFSPKESDTEKKILILFVGTITPRKGVIDLVQSLEKIELSDHVRAVLVGRTDLDEPYAERVRSKAESTSCNISLPGFVSENRLESLYEEADIFVLPSYEEGSSIAVSEAIGSKTPVIGSNIDGISTRLEENVHGLFFNPGDTDKLATHIQTLVRDDQLREKMESNMQELMERMSWAQITERVINSYEVNE